MLELIINAKQDEKEIELLNNGELIEYYTESKEEERNEGNIYIGIIKNIFPGMQSAFIDIGTGKNGFIHLKDILPKVDLAKNKNIETKKIEEVVKQNQPLLVQVKKDSNDSKGAKVSTHINLPSKYVVFTPNIDIITVSKKIEDKEECKRLIELAKKTLPKEDGVIIRTSAKGKTEEVIEDIKQQEAKWKKIKEKYEKVKDTKKPVFIYEIEGLVEKLLIDYKEDYKLIKNYIEKNKELKEIKLEVKDIEQVERKYDIPKQKEKIKNRKIWLNSGGFITIDKTEALTAIDVNTGKYTGKKDLQETVFTVNKEATIEIAKQLLLRDIGGIIIIDYIDMQNDENRRKIEKLLKEELKKDRTKTQVEGFTKLDLMELTRKHICSHRNN